VWLSFLGYDNEMIVIARLSCKEKEPIAMVVLSCFTSWHIDVESTS